MLNSLKAELFFSRTNWRIQARLKCFYLLFVFLRLLLHVLYFYNLAPRLPCNKWVS